MSATKSSSRIGSRDTSGASRKVEAVPTNLPVRKQKRTFHLDASVIDLLEKIQQADKPKNNGKRPLLSDLVAEGITLLAEQRGYTFTVE